MLWQVNHRVHLLLIFLKIEYIELLDNVVHFILHVVVANLKETSLATNLVAFRQQLVAKGLT